MGLGLLTSFAFEQFVEEDLNGVEPVEYGRLAACCYALLLEPSAEIPEPDLIEVVQADGFGACCPCGSARRNDVANVDLKEPQIFKDSHVGDVSDLDQDQHHHCHEEHEGREDGETFPVSCGIAEVGLRDGCDGRARESGGGG